MLTKSFKGWLCHSWDNNFIVNPVARLTTTPELPIGSCFITVNPNRRIGNNNNTFIIDLVNIKNKQLKGGII